MTPSRSNLLSLPLALLFACTGKDGAPADDTAVAMDADGDGFETPADCDDGNNAINPDALEVCDGLDDNCDGVVDTDAADRLPWYADADGDGYGAAGDSTLACDAPAGTAADDADCDDADPSANPAATESCDGVDDDCDGDIDEDVLLAWYRDFDGDGYGDPATATDACTRPSGYVAAGGDCDDENASLHPGATETCDGRDFDEDCDGAADDADDEAAGKTLWYADADGDGHGDAAVTRMACDQPAAYAGNADDCDDTAGTLFPGGVEQCDGHANDCDTEGSWNAAAERGIASWIDAGGAWSVVTGTVGSGTRSSPTTWAAPEDGELRLCDGTWYLLATVDGHTVRLTGQNGAATTTLDAGDTGRVVSVSAGGLTVDGLTLTGGSTSGSGAGLDCDTSDLVVSDTVVRSNTSTGYGGGIALEACPAAEIRDTELDGNIGSVAGGLYAHDSDGLVLDGLDVHDNYGGRAGGGLYLSYADFTFTSSTVSGNATDPSYSAGGLMDYYSNGTIDSVVFEGNSSSYGGGLEVTNSTVSMSDSDVSANIGGAIYGFVSSTLTVSDTDFADNTATYQGNIYLDNLVSSTFTGCTFTDNAGGTAGVFSFSRTSSANFLSTDFSGNTPYDAWAAGTGYTFGSSAAGNCSDSTGCI
jgi:hypothetical protein